jgi:four helix bundle protein
MGRNFKTLKAWELADNLAVELYRITRTFPKEELYGLTSQIRRAAVSVPANIAEGASRQTKKDFIHFLVIARASLAEVEYYIHLTQRLGYLSVEEGIKLSAMLKETAITLNGYINSIRTAEHS